MSARPIGHRAEQMRRDFDRRFAELPCIRETAHVDLLGIRLCGDPYALRLADVVGLFADKRLTRWPCHESAFLGIAGFRGRLLPAYDLGALLGYPPASTGLRWLVLAAASPVALGFDGLDGCLRLPGASIARPPPTEVARPHVHELVRLPTDNAPQGSPVLRPLVDLASALAAVRQGASEGSPPSPQERPS